MLYFIAANDGNYSGFIGFKESDKGRPYITKDKNKANIFTFRKAHNFINNYKDAKNTVLEMYPVSFQSNVLLAEAVEDGLTPNKLKGVVFDICQLSRDLTEYYNMLCVKSDNNIPLTDNELILKDKIPKILKRQFRNINLETVFDILPKE